MKMKEKPKKENSERWLLTYSDLITLLVALFILMYAMSSVDSAKYEELSQSLSESMGQGASIFDGGADTGVLPDGGNSVLDIGTNTGQSGNNTGSNSGKSSTAASATPTPTSMPQEDTNTETTGALSGNLDTENEMKNLQAYVNNVLEDMNMGASVDTSIEERGLTITFKNDVFFDSGSDALKTGMKGSLDKIASLLNRIDNPIVVEGYTDNVPISSKKIYASNWQLSAARAANVAQYLVDEEGISGERLSAVGYGEFRPVASNDTAQGRSKNRRVEIVILYGAQ